MNFWQKRKIYKILNDATGPSPWYLHEKYAPVVSGYEWCPAGEDSDELCGKYLLKRGESVFLILDMYNYVKLMNNDQLLIWNQRYIENSPTQPIKFTILDITNINPIEGDINILCKKMKAEGEAFLFNSSGIIEFELLTHIVDKNIEIGIPDALRKIEELLILCDFSGINNKGTSRGNRAIMIVKPKENTFRIYPQDWFNNSNCDFGYQWITRVARSKKTGEIYGDGIRISPFVLDDSLRNVKKVFY